MPRSGRVFIESACYHIIMRGSRRQSVFRDEDDRLFFIRLIRKYKLKYGSYVYGYCLMDNHVHLIAKFPRGRRSMSSFVHGVNLSYAMHFNSRYHATGHLWQNQYKSFVILKDDHLINVISYVEFKPVRSKTVSRPEEYPWSSYRARVTGTRDGVLDVLSL